MFIAHLPAAYLLTRVDGRLSGKPRWFVVGAIAPDLDMLAFCLLDGGAVHHHNYLTHRPFLWACLILLGGVLGRFKTGRCAAAFGMGGLFHLLLDTPVGAIAWAWPFSDTPITMVIVQPAYDWWVLSFLTHWTFGVEIMICLASAWVFIGRRVQRGCTLPDTP